MIQKNIITLLVLLSWTCISSASESEIQPHTQGKQKSLREMKEMAKKNTSKSSTSSGSSEEEKEKEKVQKKLSYDVEDSNSEEIPSQTANKRGAQTRAFYSDIGTETPEVPVNPRKRANTAQDLQRPKIPSKTIGNSKKERVGFWRKSSDYIYPATIVSLLSYLVYLKFSSKNTNQLTGKPTLETW